MHARDDDDDKVNPLLPTNIDSYIICVITSLVNVVCCFSRFVARYEVTSANSVAVFTIAMKG